MMRRRLDLRNTLRSRRAWLISWGERFVYWFRNKMKLKLRQGSLMMSISFGRARAMKRKLSFIMDRIERGQMRHTDWVRRFKSSWRLSRSMSRPRRLKSLRSSTRRSNTWSMGQVMKKNDDLMDLKYISIL